MLLLNHEQRQKLYRAGISRQNVYNWTRKGIRPTPDMAQVIADVKGVPITTILFPQEEKENTG